MPHLLAPAVHQHAPRKVAGLVISATGLFAAGVAFGDQLVLPPALKFLAGYDAQRGGPAR